MTTESNKFNLDSCKYNVDEKIMFRSFQNIIEKITAKMESEFSIPVSEIKKIVDCENVYNYKNHNIDSSTIVNTEDIIICLKSYTKYKFVGGFVIDNITPLSCKSSKLENIGMCKTKSNGWCGDHDADADADECEHLGYVITKNKKKHPFYK